MRFQLMLLASVLVAASAAAQQSEARSQTSVLEDGLSLCRSVFEERHPPSAERVAMSKSMTYSEAMKERASALGLTNPTRAQIEARGWRATGRDETLSASVKADWGMSVLNWVGSSCSVFVTAYPTKTLDAANLVDKTRSWVADVFPDAKVTPFQTNSVTGRPAGHASLEWQSGEGIRIRLVTTRTPSGDDSTVQIHVSYKPQLPPPT